MSHKPTVDPNANEPAPTTFRDVPATPVCPECGGEAKSRNGAEVRCANGHTWTPSERTLKL